MKIPKVGNILIPTIEKKVERKLKELNLKPEIEISDFLKIHKNKKHRYFTPCLTKEGEKIAFYSRVHFNLDAKNKIIREIEFLKKLKKSKLKIKKIVPEILNYGIEKDFEWFEREYPPGTPLGESRKLKQKLKIKIIPEIIKIIFEISKIPPSFFPKIKKFNPKNYLAERVYEELVNKKILEKNLAKSIQEFIEKNIPLLKKENKYFCHGDLNLGNIISDGKRIWLIDWELIQINNFAYDIGYLWSHLWQAKKSFRQKLILDFLKKLPSKKIKKFKILFPIVTSYLALGGIRGGTKKRREFYSKIFKNCLDFKKLIDL
jgi:thiamine kinase-like enzyme